jgi:hypothetical protein
MRSEGSPVDSVAVTVVSTVAAVASLAVFEWTAYFGLRSVSESMGQLVYVQLPALIAGGVAVDLFARHSFVSACWRCTAVLATSSLLLAAFYAVVSHPI